MSVTSVVLATNNPKKLAELRRIAGQRLDVLGLADFEPYPAPAETARTFEGNALIKARAAAEHTGLPALADDSGLEVDVLNSMPGVRSARWAGPEGDDEANLRLLLRQIDDVEAEERGARFVCAMAYCLPGGQTHTERGIMPGTLATAATGDHGFGYDPIFVPDGYTVTTAELEPDAKDAISHRGQAVRAIVPALLSALDSHDPEGRR